MDKKEIFDEAANFLKILDEPINKAEEFHKSLNESIDKAMDRIAVFCEFINALESKVDSGVLERETTPEGVAYRLSSRVLESEMKNTVNVEQFLKEYKEILLSQSLPEHLNMLLERKGLKRADVVRGSLLDRSYVYLIFSGKKTPSRDKLIAIAFGLKLSVDETQKMLKLSGNRELYAIDRRDAIILFAQQREKDIYETI